MLPSSPTDSRFTRLFLALWPNDVFCGQLADHCSTWVWPAGGVLYQPQDWHVTLHFIGTVDANQLDSIGTRVDMPCQPFELVLDQPQLWPNGLAVLCASTVPTPLCKLHDLLGQELRALDLPMDARPYQPHVTLARRADGAVAPPAAGMCAVTRWWWHTSLQGTSELGAGPNAT